MTNTNCLEGLQCPTCKSYGPFWIRGSADIRMTDGGSEECTYPDWDQLDTCRCETCGFAAAVADFNAEQSQPPVPDNKNGERAEWARAALRAFMKETGTEYEDSLGDLLCNLMHLADRDNFDFEAALHRAQDHYAAETGAAPY